MANLGSATTVNYLSGESSEVDLKSTHPDSSDDTSVKKSLKRPATRRAPVLKAVGRYRHTLLRVSTV